MYALALANVASVYLAEEHFSRAEQMYRDVLRRFSETLSPDNLNIAITQIKLGRALVKQKRYAEAESPTLAGYNTLMKQTSPTVSWVQSARKDLVIIYDALNHPEKAAPFRAYGAK